MLELEQADLWDGIAGWASGPRNEAWVEVLRRRAPGARVLDIRAGAGVFSVIAARFGAARVVAWEPSELADVARELAARNHLADRIHVEEGALDAVPPGSIDFAFSASIASDPFADGWLRQLETAAGALAPGGRLSPRRIAIRAALAAAPGQAAEAAAALAELDRWEARYALDLGPVRASLASPGPYRLFTEAEDPLGPPVVVWDLALGTGERPRPRTVAMSGDGTPAGGAVAWSELDLDDGIALGGPPGAGAPWPALVVAWADPLPTDRPRRVRWSTLDGRVVARADLRGTG